MKYKKTDQNPFVRAIINKDANLVAHLLQQGHHLVQPKLPLHLLATFNNCCPIVQTLFVFSIPPDDCQPLIQSLKHNCSKCTTYYSKFINTNFNGSYPIEFAIANCKPATVQLLINLGCKSQVGILRMAVLRGDLQILALILVMMFEQKTLDKEEDVIKLAVQNNSSL